SGLRLISRVKSLSAPNMNETKSKLSIDKIKTANWMKFAKNDIDKTLNDIQTGLSWFFDQFLSLQNQENQHEKKPLQKQFKDHRFEMKWYSTDRFDNLRNVFNLSIADFKFSLCAKKFKSMKNPGKSNSLLFKTHDEKYIIKTVTKRECETLKKYLEEYYA
ncbi:MAG: Phosphatidylinositol 4-phosphate 5-kinase type-1 beta, partial [Paramarteilia canceri]